MNLQTKTATIETVRTDIRRELDENGNQRFTHIVNCPDEYDTTGDYLMAAIIEGFEVEALCGKRWLPIRDPKKYPVCQPCIDEALRIQGEVFGS